MKKYLNFTYDIINIVLLFLVISTLSMYVLLLLNLAPQADLFLVIPSLLLYSYLLNLRVKNFIIYIFLHILLFVCIQMVPIELPTRIISCIVYVFICMNDISFWKNQDQDLVFPLPGFIGLIFLVTCIHGSQGLSIFLGNYSYYCGVLYVVLYLLRIYLNNMLQFQSNISEKSYIPLKEIVKQNTGIISIFTTLLLILSLLFHSRTLENLLSSFLQLIGSGLKNILSFLLSLIPRSKPTEDTEFLTDRVIQQPMFPEPEAKQSIITYLLDLLFIIIQYAIIAGIVCLAIYSVYLFIKNHLHRSEANTKKDDQFDVIEVKERMHRSKEKSKLTFFNRKDGNETIRYYYKKHIRQLMKRGYHPQQKHTPLERNEDVKVQMNTSLNNLTEYYCIARYSNESLTKEQVNHAKQAE